MPWTPENIERVRSLADAGFSATRIAAQIGGVSRNAVVGVGARNNIKFHGLSSGHRGGPKPAGDKPEAPSTPTRRQIVNNVLRQSETTAMKPLMLTFDELNRDDCKYPFGDSEFRFCGLPAIEGLPYCLGCSKIAYRPPEHRR